MEFTTSQPALREFASGLSQSRIAWLVCPWDTAPDEFLSCLYKLHPEWSDTYRLDASSYNSLNQFNETLDGKAGCTSIDLCNLLKDQESPTLIIDNIPNHQSQSEKLIFEELRGIAQIFIEFCPNLRVILRSKITIPYASLNPFTLRKMDEADCNKYLMSHPDGRNINNADVATSWIYENSGGLPKAVDRILEKLRYMSIEDLANASSDLSINFVNSKYIPEELSKIIIALSSRNDDEGKRTYALLQCLTILPFGEEFTNFKRFHQDSPFYPQHVDMLLEAGLADTRDFFTLQATENKPKVTVAKRVAQDFTKSKLSIEEFSNLSLMAASFYFGRDWKTGKFKLNSHLKLDRHNSSAYAIQNANTLIKRLMIDAIESDGNRAKQDTLRLLAFYTNKLELSHQYRLLVDLCHTLIPSLKALEHRFSEDILVRYARSLRMLREYDSALEIFEYVLTRLPTAQIKAEIHLEVAYCHKALEQEPQCLAAASSAKNYKPGSAISLQAESIIISLLPTPKRLAKLKKLKKTCASKGHKSVENIISLAITGLTEDPEKAIENYQEIASKAYREKDTYNAIRAIIHYSRCITSSGARLSEKDLSNLILGYHFVASQRMMYLFNLSTEALWIEFENASDSTALYLLYQQSSLLYRLNADPKTEKKYLARLVSNPRHLKTLTYGLPEADKEYLKKRAEELGVTRTLEQNHRRSDSLN